MGQLMHVHTTNYYYEAPFVTKKSSRKSYGSRNENHILQACIIDAQIMVPSPIGCKWSSLYPALPDTIVKSRADSIWVVI
jgi:hypothetical protein